jgi:hypothetical protein
MSSLCAGKRLSLTLGCSATFFEAGFSKRCAKYDTDEPLRAYSVVRDRPIRFALSLLHCVDVLDTSQPICRSFYTKLLVSCAVPAVLDNLCAVAFRTMKDYRFYNHVSFTSSFRKYHYRNCNRHYLIHHHTGHYDRVPYQMVKHRTLQWDLSSIQDVTILIRHIISSHNLPAFCYHHPVSGNQDQRHKR